MTMTDVAPTPIEQDSDVTDPRTPIPEVASGPFPAIQVEDWENLETIQTSAVLPHQRDLHATKLISIIEPEAPTPPTKQEILRNHFESQKRDLVALLARPEDAYFHERARACLRIVEEVLAALACTGDVPAIICITNIEMLALPDHLRTSWPLPNGESIPVVALRHDITFDGEEWKPAAPQAPDEAAWLA